MAVSRDRLSREDSIIASYSQRRVSRNIGRGNPIPFVLVDDNEEGMNARTPFRWRDTTMAGNAGSPRFTPQNLSYLVGSGRSRVGGFGTTSIRRFGRLAGPENLGSSRGRGGALPAWYPRKPLNDITAVVKAFERRRREQRGGGEGLQTAARVQPSTPSAHLEQNKAMISPVLYRPRSIGKVPKILLDITHQEGGDAAACLTPQKKLLNSIDVVERVVMEELQKMKRTPSAKRAERERRVRTLMSMR
ncbi:protein POLYCHOME-like [Salvia splendens]|uniref:protein POLYCHOME-like n=1 Tax=Salvia splendens TaxID=180675 RepID=UPI001C25D26F|nr:protein POLYCHOME-like [Salvia splendens]